MRKRLYLKRSDKEPNLELLVISRLVMHLDFESIDFEQLCPLLRLLFAVCTSSSGVIQFLDELRRRMLLYQTDVHRTSGELSYFGQPVVLLSIKP